MMPISPSAAQLLTDLAAHGIEVKLLGDSIRYRPPSAMTPALLERLKLQKTELLRFFNTEAAVKELLQSVERFWKDPAWHSAWERRFKVASYANLDSLRRVLRMVIDQAEEHHRRRDWIAFASACRYVHRLASGEEWDNTKPIPDDDRWNIDH